MGYGAGSALTVFPIAAMIKSDGYEATFFSFGLGQGAIIFVLGWFLRAPAAGHSVPAKAGAAPAVSTRDYSTLEMLRSPAFYVMYTMFVLATASGLVATAQLTPIAKDFKIAEVPVSLIGLTLPALTFALSLDRVLNGLSRPLFGWISDHLGRENTMFLAFALQGAVILVLAEFGTDPTLFVILTALVYLAWGASYSLFPATCGDTYGKKFAAANAGLLYTAKGTASLLVPLSSLLAASKGGWHAVFVTSSVMNFAAAALALLALKPLRARMRA